MTHDRSLFCLILALAAAACGTTTAGSTNSTGGQDAAGAPASGGQSTSGSGGTSTGGTSTGGASTGGTSTGGASAGGSATGGTSTGGTSTGGSGTVDCNCMVAAYIPVCGVDGTTHDAACGRECVPVAIACDQACPCPSATCTEDCTSQGLACCDGECANTQNDPQNCGTCGTTCSGDTSYCNVGTCEAPPCSTTTCSDPTSCCGSECCGAGQLCCLTMAGPWFTACADPVDGTCPVGCPMCVCADPDTPIATPDGERPIADLRVGDLVYSTDDRAIRAVPILRTNRTPVRSHRIVRVALESGRVLEISAPHPTADGRRFGQLHAGDTLDGVAILSVEIRPYAHNHTYDILPASSSGSYFAAGVEIGSTLVKATP